MVVQKQKGLTAAADSSFLIGLSLIRRVQILRHMFDELFIAPAVWEEVVTRGRGRPGADEIRQADFVKKRTPLNQSSVQMLELFLGRGESETLVIAKEIPCDVVLLDDPKARKTARQAELRIMGIGGFLLAAKQLSLINSVADELAALQKKGFRFSRSVINAILQKAGEA